MNLVTRTIKGSLLIVILNILFCILTLQLLGMETKQSILINFMTMDIPNWYILTVSCTGIINRYNWFFRFLVWYEYRSLSPSNINKFSPSWRRVYRVPWGWFCSTISNYLCWILRIDCQELCELVKCSISNISLQLG